MAAIDTPQALPAPLHLRGLKELPIVRQLLLLIGMAAAIAGGIFIFNWSQQPGRTAIFPELAGQDASAAADALRTAGIEYELDAVTGRLMVDGAKVHEARLLLASQGLPRSGGESGFEMMQQDPGMGVSSFLEGARYNHALETELARSVGRLAPVKGARVHLAIPKPSAFARPGDGASASVLVELHPGRTLEANQVQAIVHMVARAKTSSLSSAQNRVRVLARASSNWTVLATSLTFWRTMSRSLLLRASSRAVKLPNISCL